MTCNSALVHGFRPVDTGHAPHSQARIVSAGDKLILKPFQNRTLYSANANVISMKQSRVNKRSVAKNRQSPYSLTSVRRDLHSDEVGLGWFYT